MATNTINTVIGAADWASNYNTGYQSTVQSARKFETVLLEMLHGGDTTPHVRHLVHKTMPKHLGTVLNQRRYFDLDADPTTLKFDKNTITGPALKEIRAAAVEARLEWYGSGFELNDTLNVTSLDALMSIYLPVIYRNARSAKDYLAAAAMYTGASKVFLKNYEYNKATGETKNEFGALADVVAGDGTAGKRPYINHDLLNILSTKFLENNEEYVVTPAVTGANPVPAITVTVPAIIKPFERGRYKVLVSPSGMNTLLSDEKYKEDAVRGISARTLTDNKVTDYQRYTIEEISHFITLDDTGAIKYDKTGKLHIAFIFGQEFGFDVELAGQGLKVYTKTDGQADSGDKYGRLNFITYKMAYVAKVSNSMAITAIVFKPSISSTGSIVSPALADKAPIQ